MNENIIYGPFVALILGIILIIKSLKRQRQVQEVKNQGCSKIASAPQGLNEFQGFAWPMSVGPKNYKQQELVYHSFHLQELVTSGYGKNRKSEWKTVFSRGHFNDFYLVDPTGITILSLANAEILFNSNRTRRWFTISTEEKNFCVKEVINTSVIGFPPSPFFFGIFGSTFRIVDTEVFAGSPLYAKGDFRTEGTYNDKIKLQGLTLFSNKVFNNKTRSIRNIDSLLDTDKNGKVTYQESIEGHTHYAKYARKQSALENAKIQEQEFAVFGILQTSNQHKMMLADSHQKQLLDQLKKGNILLMIAGCMLLALSLSFFSDLIKIY